MAQKQYGAAMGLGYLSSVAAQRFQMAAMFVPIVIIAGLGAGVSMRSSLARRGDKPANLHLFSHLDNHQIFAHLERP